LTFYKRLYCLFFIDVIPYYPKKSGIYLGFKEGGKPPLGGLGSLESVAYEKSVSLV